MSRKKTASTNYFATQYGTSSDHAANVLVKYGVQPVRTTILAGRSYRLWPIDAGTAAMDRWVADKEAKRRAADERAQAAALASAARKPVPPHVHVEAEAAPKPSQDRLDVLETMLLNLHAKIDALTAQVKALADTWGVEVAQALNNGAGIPLDA